MTRGALTCVVSSADTARNEHVTTRTYHGYVHALITAFVLMCSYPGVWETGVYAADFSNVPGVKISHIDPPDIWDQLLGNERYIADPSITIMPNGDYIASRSEFGSGSTADTSGETKVFRSTNKGASWSLMSEPTDILRATLFTHNGELYMLGYKAESSDIVIRESTNSGATWSANTVIKSGSYGGTPNTPVVYDGKIWIGQGGTRVLSASVGADLMQSASWKLSNSASFSGNPFGDAWQGWSEAQIVASPQTGVVLMPKIRALPHTALIQVNESTGNVSFDAAAEDAFPSLPGGEKKFGAQYDPVSGKFYALTNTVLPAHANHPTLSDEPELIRNTATLLSSTDLINWDVEKIFLYTKNIDNGSWGEGFQYFNFTIDGDDLAVVSRTAFDTTGDGLDDKPPRGHDSNMLTFHRIEGFRTLTPDHLLKIENGEVMRYEVNGGNDLAPLGRFALGTLFNGSPLVGPAGVSQDTGTGDVFIRETGGRVLRFDAAGNFQGIENSGSHQGTSEVSVIQPNPGERSWINSAAGNWSDPTNWYYWGRPDTNREVANFGSATDALTFITVDGSYKIKGLRFQSVNRYRLNGDDELGLESASGHSILDVREGDHNLYVPVKLYSDTDATTVEGSALRFRDLLDLNGHTLHVSGSNGLYFQDDFVMHGGSVAIHDHAWVTFVNTSIATLDGTLQLILDTPMTLEVGDAFTLINGAGKLNGATFNGVVLPALDSGLRWDISGLYVDGVVSVAASIPGDLNGDGFVGITDLNIVLGRWNNAVTPGSWLMGDPNGDGYVGIADLNVVLGNWNAGTPPTAIHTTIPEPATQAVILLGGISMLPQRRPVKTGVLSCQK